jgi:hypothetical protein
MSRQSNKRWETQIPKYTWREWLQKRSKDTAFDCKTTIYSSRQYKYEGSHIKFMENEFKHLGFLDNPTDSEIKLRDSIRHIMSYLCDNWESAESAYHTVKMVDKLLHYQLLAPLMGDDDEWLPPDDRGNERNKRNPGVKRYDNDSKKLGFKEKLYSLFDVLIAVLPNGKRTVEPGGQYGLSFDRFPINPSTEHICLRETMSNYKQGQTVRELFDGNLYHFKPKKEIDMDTPIYSKHRANQMEI